MGLSTFYLRNIKVLVFFLLIPALAVSQAPSGIVWDVADFDVAATKDCLKGCQGSTVTYTLVGDPTPWIDVQWQVNGGIVQNQSNHH